MISLHNAVIKANPGAFNITQIDKYEDVTIVSFRLGKVAMYWQLYLYSKDYGYMSLTKANTSEWFITKYFNEVVKNGKNS